MTKKKKKKKGGGGGQDRSLFIRARNQTRIRYARSLNTEFHCLYSYKYKCNNAYNECYFKWLNSTHCQTFRTNTLLSTWSTVLIYKTGGILSLLDIFRNYVHWLLTTHTLKFSLFITSSRAFPISFLFLSLKCPFISTFKIALIQKCL